jgi:hypothetical protein
MDRIGWTHKCIHTQTHAHDYARTHINNLQTHELLNMFLLTQLGRTTHIAKRCKGMQGDYVCMILVSLQVRHRNCSICSGASGGYGYFAELAKTPLFCTVEPSLHEGRMAKPYLSSASSTKWKHLTLALSFL